MAPARVITSFTLSLAATACLTAAAVAGPISTQFTLNGSVVTPGTYDLAALSALPPTTQTVTYTAGGGPVTDTYTGTNLWTLVNSAGGFTPAPGVKNSTLRNYVVAVGSDGYKTVFAGGEINPKFGDRPYMAAYADTGGQLGPGGTDGFARMVVPGDKAGGRYVSNLVTLHAGTAPSLPGTGGGVSSQFTLTGGVATPGTYTLATLMSFPATTLTTTYLSGSSSVTDTFTGVSLWTLLSSAGIVTDAAIKNDILRKYVVAVGSDGYEVDLLSWRDRPRLRRSARPRCLFGHAGRPRRRTGWVRTDGGARRHRRRALRVQSGRARRVRRDRAGTGEPGTASHGHLRNRRRAPATAHTHSLNPFAEPIR